MIYALHLSTDDIKFITVESVNYDNVSKLREAHEFYEVYDDGASHWLLVCDTKELQEEIMQIDIFSREDKISKMLHDGRILSSIDSLIYLE